MKKVNRGDALSIASRDWNSLVDMRNANSAGMADRSRTVASVGMNAGWVWVKNTSGSDRNRFDCMALGDPVIAIETNAQQDVVFEVTTADADKTPVILIEPIANGLCGRAVIYGLTLATVAAATSTGMLCGLPSGSGNNLAASYAGPVKLLKAPSTTGVSLIPVILGANNERGVHFYSASNIAAFDETTKQMGSGTVRRWKSSTTGLLSDSAEDITVYNAAGQFTGGKYGYAYPNDAGLLVIAVEKCD